MQDIDFAHLGPNKGSKVVVIGGHGGIGAALSTRAAEAGAEVVALDTRRAIEEHGEIPGVTNAEIDVLDESSILAAAAAVQEQWGEIDALVYVSGIGDPDTPTLDYSVERWDKVHAVNLRGAFLATQAFVPLVSRAGTGSLVFIGSTVAIQPPPGLGAYSASKAGLVAFAKSISKELAPDVRVNVVSPGITETAFLAGGSGQGQGQGQGQGPQDISGESWFGEEAYQRRLAMILQRRLANPDDIVAPTLFLLSPGARYITGQTLHVNGGLYLP
jgi:NAD(P)-dependent dehydrogenase (short-subunit alcohol dehydrogenase family)